jgi:flagellin
MARINTNVASLIAQQNLTTTTNQEDSTLQRLSTGLRINSGADDPAGLIASEGLKSEIAGITQAISNSTQASNVIATADGALSQVSSLLDNMQSLIVEAANTGGVTPDEINANQLQIDSAVQSITRISNTTSFAGLNLLNGALDYITSGVNTSAISSLDITQANFGTQPNVPVSVNVVASAKNAQLEFRSGAVTSSVTLDISGAEGVDTLTFISGTKASAIVFAINTVSDSTGVQAKLLNAANAASGLMMYSSDFGSSAFVSVQAQSGAFATTDVNGDDKQRTIGADAVATINGALAIGSGRTIKLNTSTLDMSLTLGQNFGIGDTSFNITGGGALFQLGPEVTSNSQVGFGIGSVAADHLGDSVDGFLNEIATGGKYSLVAGGAAQASKIVADAIEQVADLRGRLGAFEKNTLNTNAASLGITLENVTSSESTIDDADFASETANLTREQILQQAGTSVLSQANSIQENILTLLQH